jgi:hypothetical protein
MRGGAAVCCFVVGISVRNGYLFLASRNAGRALGKARPRSTNFGH